MNEKKGLVKVLLEMTAFLVVGVVVADIDLLRGK